ncbi:MAG: permease [Pseudomonadota bacterium]|nr:permease [Pseudomonadota bacterium]
MNSPRQRGHMTLFFVLLTGLSGVGLYLTQGAESVIEATGEGLQLIVLIMPILVAALLVAGYAQVLLPRQTVESWLGTNSGLRGLLIATVAGALTPGGPFAAFPLVLALYQAGAAFEICVAFVTAWSVLGLSRVLVWEIPFLGWDFVLLRYAVSLPLPIVAGFTARAFRLHRLRSSESTH